MRPRVGLGFAAFLTGEWEEALQHSCGVIDLAQRVGLPRGTALGLAIRGLVLLRKGRLDDAAACATRAREALGHQSWTDRHVLGPVEAVEASVALARGDAATAAAMAAESLHCYTTLSPLTQMVLAEAQAAGGDPQAASATAGTLAAMGPGAPYPGALAAWLQGRLDHDETLLRRAADDLATLGFGYEAAVARIDLAELTATQDGNLVECLQIPERLGAQPQLDRARRLLRRLGQRPTAPPRRWAGPLSPREEQVARLVAAGLSNPEIAQRMYLSPRTVTTHLQNMYGRLELRSRTALTRYVLEQLPPDERAG
jgi:ATP/maltotriose-dependent transcriptional regulator MalT